MSKVKCHVNTCTHWMGGMCGAHNIDILPEEEGKMARIDEQTECKTFYKRDGLASYLGSMDNVNWSGMTSTMVGGEMSPSITCAVNSCVHWGDGDVCHADAIEVVGSNADECQDTNCRTFKQR
ncbi:MAG: DUF1540 domain-containing protein [Bacillota bacterium]